MNGWWDTFAKWVWILDVKNRMASTKYLRILWYQINCPREPSVDHSLSSLQRIPFLA